MESALTSSKKSAIGLLLINDVKEMAEIALRTIRKSTDAQIFLGYNEESQIKHFGDFENVTLIDLKEDFDALSLAKKDNAYSSWADTDFFKIVQLKWCFLKRILSYDFDFVIYCDVDVIWLQDASKLVSQIFTVRENKHILVQSFTRSPSEPNLCMGFVAFRNGELVTKFIEHAQSQHASQLNSNDRFGDDDVVTLLYKELDYPEYFLELPQTTFPVGVMVSLFKSWNDFPGIRAQAPYIFHANYVVGQKNKLLLMKYFLGSKLRSECGINFTFSERILFISKKFKWAISDLLVKH